MRYFFFISLVALWATFVIASPLPLRLGGLGGFGSRPKPISAPKPVSDPEPGSSSSSSSSSSCGFFSSLFGKCGGSSSSSSSKPSPAPAAPSPAKESPAKQSPAIPSKSAAAAPSKSEAPSSQSAAPVAQTAAGKSSASVAAKSSSTATGASSGSSAPTTTATATTKTQLTTTTATSLATTSSSIDRAAWPTIPIAGARPPTFDEAKKAIPPKVVGISALAGLTGAGPDGIEFSNLSESDFVPTELQRRGKKGKPTDPSLCPKSAADFDAHMADCAPDECAFYSRVGGKEHDWAIAQNPPFKLLKDKLDPAFITTNKNSRCDNFWEFASQAFAQRANGRVVVLLPPVDAALRNDRTAVTSWPLKDNGVDKTIWELHEWPALQLNTAVKQVWRVDIQGSAPLELLVRP